MSDIIYLYPNSDEYIHLVATGYPHYAQIDEDKDNPDDDTSYITNASCGIEANRHGLQDTETLGTISKVTVYWRYKLYDTGGIGGSYGVTFVGKIYTHNVLYDGVNGAWGDVGDGYKVKSKEYTTNPNTDAAWTWEEINALQVYIAMCAGIFDACQGYRARPRCTQIYVKVEGTFVQPPATTTNDATDITYEEGKLNGEITDNGEEDAYKRGFIWHGIGDSTTVDGDSNSGQKVLLVSDTTIFSIGDDIIIHRDGGREERGTIASIDEDISITLEADLTYTHLSSDADSVEVANQTTTTEKEGSTVDANSAADQKVVNVAATTDFAVSDIVILNPDGDREEIGEIDSINAGVSITLVANLAYAHTAEQADEVLVVGYGVAAFEKVISSLDVYSPYYFKAWARNRAGIGYGDWVKFTTAKSIPEVTTNDASDIASDQVTLNGNITHTGGDATCTKRGFEYGLTKTNTWKQEDDVGGYGTGEYSKTAGSLQANTIYWVRAYAINTIGTGYGEWVMFQTAASGTTPSNTKIFLGGDLSGYISQMHAAETDLGADYEGYFVIATDLSGESSLNLNKRLLELINYFRKEDAGTITISVKCDHETSWREIGSINLTGYDDIVTPFIAPDELGRHFLIKFAGENIFRYIGTIFGFITQGVR